MFPSVRKAEKIVYNQSINLDKEYSPMEGFHIFNKEAFKLLFADYQLEKTVNIFLFYFCYFNKKYFLFQSVTVQTLAGTGALDLGAAFLGKFFEANKQVFLSQPSWVNHYFIFKNYNFDVNAYRYYDNKQKSFDSVGFFEDLEKIPDHSVILFQPCGHNPSSVQPDVCR